MSIQLYHFSQMHSDNSFIYRDRLWFMERKTAPATASYSSSSNNSFMSSIKLTAITIAEPAAPRKKSGTTTFATNRITRSIPD